MGEHVSHEGFLGGLLLGGTVVGFIAYWIAYRLWGRRRNATEVQLLAALANLESAAQDREQHERELSTARDDYQSAREDARKARDAYRTSETRFAVATRL
jgi:hypothetical protein